MIKPVAIDKDAEQYPALNFAFLRGAGIALIQQMAGKTWTDYNLHDPGITILEQLCFGITDLAYRTDFPIQDLLANEKGEIDYEKNSFFVREEALTTNPVTINDYRKSIIDEIDDIENVWLYPINSAYSKDALKGLYKVVVQVNRDVADELSPEKEEEIISLVKKCFVSKRNLCEDILEDIEILKPVRIIIEASVQIENNAKAEQVLAAVYYSLENDLSTQVKYFTEKEMRDAGYNNDEIYSGPFLKKGFIPDKELHRRKFFVDPTELVKNISQIDGVISVQKLHIQNAKDENYNKPFQIDPSSFPILDIENSEQHIKLYKDNFEVSVKRPAFRAILQKIREAEGRSFIKSFYRTFTKILIKPKRNQNSHYHSIQNNFPKVYGIGPEGLRADTPSLRKAQAKQLKAYLLLFEQMMANYLSQLDNINDFFSVDLGKVNNSTFYTKPLYDVPDIKDLLKSFTSAYPDMSSASWEAFKKDKDNDYVKTLDRISETDNKYVERKNRLFEHFFARFNEFIVPYPAQAYNAIYETELLGERVNAELKWKSLMLKNMAALSAGRTRAVDYLETKTKQNHFDFIARMRMLLYILEDNTKKKLSSALNMDHIIVEQAERIKQDNKIGEDEENGRHELLEEMPRILLDKRGMRKLLEGEGISEQDNMPNDAFLLRHQDASFLKHAIDIKNFRIGPHKDTYNIYYKSPTETKWQTISKFDSPDGAMASLKNLIKYIKNISIRSEGFYVVEHILLRPQPDTKVFGFRFIAQNGQNLMEHSKWMTFEEREETMSQLMDVLTSKEKITAEKLAPLCKVNLYAPYSDVPAHEPGYAEQDNKNLFNYFKVYAAQRENFLSRFEMVVKNDKGSMMKEDFFSLRMSVILPSWPARFQDRNFREAAMNLFRLNTPAHVKVNFRWMNVTNMRNFETLYADWRKLLAANRKRESLNELKNGLIHLLNRTN